MARRASGVKMGDDGGGAMIRTDGMAPSQIVSVSASVIFPCTLESKRRFLPALADLRGPRKRAVKWLCVCVVNGFLRSLERLGLGVWNSLKARPG